MTYEEAFPNLYAIAHRVGARVAGPAHAEDIAAEALTRAYVHWRRLRDDEHRRAWVARVATNLGIDHLRRTAPRLLEAEAEASTDTGAELRIVLSDALRRLPKRQREVVALRLLVDLPELEVARLLGVSAGTVKQHLTRGVSALRAVLPPDTLQEVRG